MPTSDSLNTGILEILWSAGPVAKVVLGILLLFSIISWALIVEKWWQLRRVRRQTLGFVKIFREGRRPSIVWNDDSSPALMVLMTRSSSTDGFVRTTR